jgi:large subunit ribosomal protein L24
MKLKVGDAVIVTLGKDNGRKGKIEKVFPKKNTVLVPGVNMYKRNMKKRDDKHPGGIIDFTRPLSISKVALMCPKCNQRTRVGYLINGTEKTRICRKCGQTI